MIEDAQVVDVVVEPPPLVDVSVVESVVAAVTVAGPAATISVGTVATGSPGSSASVTNVGTSSAAVLNIAIPAGATGATGAPGTTSWAGITDKPAVFAPTSHTHLVSDTTGLQAALDAKQDASTAVTLTGTATLTNKTLTTPRIAQINDSNGNSVLTFTAGTSPATNINVRNHSATPTIESVGTPSDVSLNIVSKGTSTIFVSPGNTSALQLSTVTSAANFLRISGATLGNPATILATGSDTNVSMNLTTKGTGTIQANGVPVATRLTNTAALNFSSVSAQSFVDLTLTVTGAATGDAVALGTPTEAVTAGIAYTAWVSATNTVTVRAHNYTAGPLDPASGTFRATIIR